MARPINRKKGGIPGNASMTQREKEEKRERELARKRELKELAEREEREL